MVFTGVTCTNPKAGSGMGTDGGDDKCIPHLRNFNGFCTNLAYPLAGTVDSSQFSYDANFRSPKYLPSARLISNIVANQDIDESKENRHGLTDFTTFFAQFLDHNMFATGMVTDDPKMQNNILIPPGDRVVTNFSDGSLPFSRSIKSCESNRPVNCLPSAIDLSGVYGSKANDVDVLRKNSGRLFDSSRGKFLPTFTRRRNTSMVYPHTDENEFKFSHQNNFFAAGDRRANENMVLASLHTLFLREHNRLVNLLKKRFRSSLIREYTNLGTGDSIYQLAKQLNEAAFQSIVVNEFYPSMTGSLLPDISYSNLSNPAMSDIFSSAAFRVGHTMVGNEILLLDSSLFAPVRKPVSEIFFTPIEDLTSIGIESVLRGAFWHRAQEIDVKVVHALRNHLFVNVQSETKMVDLVSLNLQRNRDHDIPSFSDIRRFLGFSSISRMEDITSDKNTISLLNNAYGSRVGDVEAFLGFLAEDHESGRPMGKTLAKMWEVEFTRVLKGDRFNFKEWNSYHPFLHSGSC